MPTARILIPEFKVYGAAPQSLSRKVDGISRGLGEAEVTAQNIDDHSASPCPEVAKGNPALMVRAAIQGNAVYLLGLLPISFS